jgi:hypothetical protein
MTGVLKAPEFTMNLVADCAYGYYAKVLFGLKAGGFQLDGAA